MGNTAGTSAKERDVELARAERYATSCPKGGAAKGCEGCRDMCGSGYPGRFTPAEAQRAIDAGFADRLIAMTFKRLTFLRPAIFGWEGLEIKEWRAARGMCVFFGASGACQLHGTNMKPLECRVSQCGSGSRMRLSEVPYHTVVCLIENAWRTPEAKKVLRRWRAIIRRKADRLPEHQDTRRDGRKG